MSEVEAQSRVSEMIQASVNPSQGQIEEQKQRLNTEIETYELQYGMVSPEMKCRIASREIKETADFCKWLLLLKIRGRFDGRHRSSLPHDSLCQIQPR